MRVLLYPRTTRCKSNVCLIDAGGVKNWSPVACHGVRAQVLVASGYHAARVWPPSRLRNSVPTRVRVPDHGVLWAWNRAMAMPIHQKTKGRNGVRGDATVHSVRTPSVWVTPVGKVRVAGSSVRKDSGTPSPTTGAGYPQGNGRTVRAVIPERRHPPAGEEIDGRIFPTPHDPSRYRRIISAQSRLLMDTVYTIF
jgi:hypothetical protein